jgi:glycerol-3-phosphate acyltransferase PlsX
LKGNDAVKRAAEILERSGLSIHFKGFVEGNDIPAGTVDVVVTDGFTGNIALKVAEGTARLTTHFLKRALSSSPLARAGALLARGALRDLRARVDPRQYDGAMMLGLKGVCVKSHGSTDAVGFANALGVAEHLITDRVNEEIKKEFKCLYSYPATNAQSAIG